jgi:hypothetical protein
MTFKQALRKILKAFESVEAECDLENYAVHVTIKFDGSQINTNKISFRFTLRDNGDNISLLDYREILRNEVLLGYFGPIIFKEVNDGSLYFDHQDFFKFKEKSMNEFLSSLYEVVIPKIAITLDNAEKEQTRKILKKFRRNVRLAFQNHISEDELQQILDEEIVNLVQQL